MRSLLVVAFPFCITGLSAQAPAPAWSTPPKLVVGIVVDQMRTDYIYRYWDNFGDGGFRRLVQEGSFQRDAHYNYAPTQTGPGHASIYTGTTPMDHGIVANDMFIRSTGKGLYCVQDDGAKGVGAEGYKGQRSPVNLLTTTIADELERRTDGRSRTIAVAMKDRSCILPIGRTGDAAYWFFEDAEGRFATSDWYRKELPAWLQQFNDRKLALKYLAQQWELLLPLERYHQVMPDDNAYEEPLIGAAKPTLPLDVPALFAAGNRNTALIRWTPASNTLTTDLALAALKGEEMGRDGVTDLLAISYGATDEIGHELGPRALELEDMYIRLDRELERLLKALDTEVGKGLYTVFLTADHAAVDVPEYLRTEQASAGYVDMAALVGAVDAALAERFGPGKWVRKRIKEQLFLSDSLIAVHKLDRELVQRAAADVLMTYPGIADVLTASDMAKHSYPTGIRNMLQRGFMPQRSGDLCFVLRPSHLASWPGMVPKGTEHGSPWNYDTHVPVMFMGQGVRPGEVVRRTHITDVAPTVCMIVGMTMPDGCSGQVVHEAVGR
ncbi:MAG TPA: alkaline phosphatase family protein [Flavobacteriales bacterium]